MSYSFLTSTKSDLPSHDAPAMGWIDGRLMIHSIPPKSASSVPLPNFRTNHFSKQTNKAQHNIIRLEPLLAYW